MIKKLCICYESDDVVTKRNMYLKYRQKHIASTIGSAKSGLNGLKIVIWRKYIDLNIYFNKSFDMLLKSL